MSITFEEETRREQLWARIFFMGPTGSGKSRAALELGSKLYGGELHTTLINTERGRGRLYADRYTYSLIDLSGDDGQPVDQSPERFVKAIDLAESRHPGGVLVLDSASHEWMGANGVLQQADRFGEWKTVRPKHNGFVDRLMAYQGHVIVCVRAKMKYEQTEEVVDGRKKYSVNMLGVGPIQSDDFQYEFNLVGRFDQETKDVTFSGHVDPLVETVANLYDATEVAATLTKWLSEGDPQEPPEAAPEEAVNELLVSLETEKIAAAVIEEKFALARRENRGQLHPEYVADQLAKSKERLAAKAAKLKAKEPADSAVPA
jgi:hypothetical protein